MDHAHDHGHGHDHGGHYIDQLCSVAVAGVLGLIALLLYFQGALNILAGFFQQALLGGGIILIALAAVRGITLWVEVGKHKPTQQHDHHHHQDHEHQHGPECAPDHEHGPACSHEHGPHDHGHHHHHNHDHDHGHDHDPDHSHGWAPLRYAILLLPITLFFLGVPNPDFNKAYNNRVMERASGLLPPLLAVWLGESPKPPSSALDLAEEGGPVEAKGEAMGLGFKELSQAASNPNSRSYLEGRTVSLKGQFVATSNPKLFTLVRMKITCCGADAVPVKVAIMSPEPVNDINSLEWVLVKGVISFRQVSGRSEYMPVLQLASRAEGLTLNVQPDDNPFIY